MFSSVFPSSFSLSFNAFKERKKERKKEMVRALRPWKKNTKNASFSRAKRAEFYNNRARCGKRGTDAASFFVCPQRSSS